MSDSANRTRSSKRGLSWLAPLVVFTLTLLVRLTPGNVTLVGWDEWILSLIVRHVGVNLIPALEWDDLIAPTGYSYPPFFFWVSGVLVWLFGTAPFVLRLLTSLTDALAATLGLLVA